MTDYIDIKSLGAAGDGITDDSAVFNFAFTKHKNIYIPNGEYAIGQTLSVQSHTHIVASAFAHIKLKAGAQSGRFDFLLTNANHTEGNCDISISGGIWDANCGENDRGEDLFNPKATTGTMFNFFGVNGLILTDMVLKNPLCYYTRFCKTQNVKIENIKFMSDVVLGNQDGIHLAGYCKNFVIRNLWGLSGSPNDDFIAFNADDCVTRQESFDMLNGPIEDVLIENIYSERCHCFVRLLCVTSEISRVTVKNVSGGCKDNAINMDGARYCRVPVFKDEDMPNGVGNINDVLLENFSVTTSNSEQSPCIVLETNCNNFTVKNFVNNSENSPCLRVRKTCKHTLLIKVAKGEYMSPLEVDYNSDITVKADSISLIKFSRA